MRVVSFLLLIPFDYIYNAGEIGWCLLGLSVRLCGIMVVWHASGRCIDRLEQDHVL